GVARDVDDGTRRGGGDVTYDGGARTTSRRVEHHEVGREAFGAVQPAVDPVADDGRLGDVATRGRNRPRIGLHGRHRAPHPGERTGEQTDAGIEVETLVRALRVGYPENGIDQQLGRSPVHLP